jgi:hypothetical protein
MMYSVLVCMPGPYIDKEAPCWPFLGSAFVHDLGDTEIRENAWFVGLIVHCIDEGTKHNVLEAAVHGLVSNNVTMAT